MTLFAAQSIVVAMDSLEQAGKDLERLERVVHGMPLSSYRSYLESVLEETA